MGNNGSSSRADFESTLRHKLLTTYAHQPESMLRIFFYLDKESTLARYGGDKRDKYACPPVRKRLKAALSIASSSNYSRNGDAKFRKISQEIITATQEPKMDQAFRQKITEICKKIENSTPGDQIDVEGFPNDEHTVSALIGLTHAWKTEPTYSTCLIMKALPRLVPSLNLVTFANKVAELTTKNKVLGNVIMFALAGVELSAKIILNLRQWWKGEISGERCCKNIFDSVATITAGIGGGFGGAALGALVGVGPLGAVVGGIIGAILGARLSEPLSDRLSQKIFQIPKEVAEENAYKFFGLKMTATNEEINKSFKKYCLKHHPDKGGLHEDFLEVQVHMSVIKLARGEM